MCDQDKEFWSKTNFIRAFYLTNFFLALGGPAPVSTTVFVDKIQTIYESVVPVINSDQRKNYIMYKTLPREIFLDLLVFLSLENFATKVGVHSLSSNQLINETLLKIILKDYGMGNMPDPIIDLGKKGYDSLRRRQYIPIETCKVIIISQAVAAEIMRTEATQKFHKLKKTVDLARKFPDSHRKFLSSPHV